MVRSIDSLAILTNLSIKLENLVHELQKERGITAGFIARKQDEFSQELLSQRQDTNMQLQALNSFLDIADIKLDDDAINKKLQEVLSRLDGLDTMRGLVDKGAITVSDAIDYYSELNSKQLDVISSMSRLSPDPGIAVNLFAYASFLQVKEHAGIERAVGSAGFTNGEFTDESMEKFNHLVVSQQAYEKTFFIVCKSPVYR